jgi:raffinose/stachyose/melibiose transport system substrate-binding protein
MQKIIQLTLPLLIVLALLLSACAGAATPQPAEPTQAPAQPTEAPALEPTKPPEPTSLPAQPTDTTAPPTKPAEKTVITYWLDGNDLAPVIQENIIDPFNAQSETTFVEATVQANRWDAMRTSLAAGAGPDIIGTPGPSFAVQLARAGYLLPLDDLADKYGWKDLFLPWALNLGVVDGSLLSVPAEVETLVLFYNKTLFEEQGWQTPKTMDELVALSEKIKAAGIIPFAHANAEYRGANEWYVGEFLNHVAGPELVYKALTGQGRWDDPELVKAIDLLNTFQQNGWFMGGLDRYYTVTFGERDEALASGKAAMNIEGTWFIGSALSLFGEANDNPNEWNWVPVPSTSGEEIYDLGIGGSLSINKDAKNPDAAAEFLTYYYSPEVQARMINSGYNGAPVPISADLLTDVDPRYAAIIEAMGKASQTGGYGYTSWAFFPPKTEALLLDVEKVWAGDITSEEFMQQLQTQFDEEKAAGELPPIPAR